MKQRGKRIFISTFSTLLAVGGFGLLASGCSTITGYSVSSYQGPLPMEDYQWLEETETYHQHPSSPPVTIPDSSTVRK